MSEEPKSSKRNKEGKEEYRKFVKNVLTYGLDDAIANYPPAYNKLALYDNILTVKLQTLERLNKELYARLFEDAQEMELE